VGWSLDPNGEGAVEQDTIAQLRNVKDCDMIDDTQIVSPLSQQDLQNIEQGAAAAKAQEAAVEAKKAEEHREALQKAFMGREVRADAMDYLMRAVKRLAEQGTHELLVLQFPAELLSDGGRAVNNLEPDWPDSLQGFAKRAYDYYLEHLKPAGYRLRVQILDYPNGNLGEVGLFLCW